MKTVLWVGFIDLLCGFLMMIIIQVNPPSEQAIKTPPPPGNASVLISWQEGDSDVDVWLSAPGEPSPVGYSNKNGAVWDLLRDDTGLPPRDTVNPIKSNYENAYTSALPDGEYIVNVHAYGITDPYPFAVAVEVIVNTGGSSMDKVFSGTVAFSVAGEEITAVRFSIRNGALDRSSINSFPIKLRSGNK
jgi:hypothetical protein